MASSVSHADKTLRGLRHMGFARVFTQAVTWGLTALTIHLLKPSDYGLVATSGIFTTFAQLLLDGGLGDILIAQRDLSERLQGAAASAVLLIAAVLAAAVFAVAPAASRFFHTPALRAVMEVSALYLPLTALDVVPIAQLSKSMRFERIALAQTISTVAQGLSTLALASAGKGYWALIIGVFIGGGLRVALLWLFLEELPLPNLQLRILGPLVINSSHMIGQRLTYFSIDNFDLFLLGRFAGPVALGPYSVARNLASSALTQISAIVNQVTVATFAAKTEVDEQLRGLVLVISLASVTLFPLFWLVGCVSQIALPLVFGAHWASIVLPFVAFSAILPLRGIYTTLNTSIVGTGKTGTTFRNTLTWAAIIIPLMALGITKGANGVALVWVPAFPVVFYLAARRIASAFSARVSTLLRPMLKPAACATASVLLAEGALVGLHGFVPRPAVVIIQCCLGAISYWALLRLVARDQYIQALDTFRRLLRS